MKPIKRDALPFAYEDMPPRFQKMMDALRLLRECGNYDTSIAGAVGEVYAEEILGMDKGKRGLSGVDGWIDGRAVQVKTKEVRDDWMKYSLSARYVPVREGKQVGVDDLIVVMVNRNRVWVHYYGPIAALESREAKGIHRYHLHQMDDGQGLAQYKKHIGELFPESLSKKSSGMRRSGRVQAGDEIKQNRLIIRKAWEGKNINLLISDQNTGNQYHLPHDELIQIIKKCAPNALESKSWLFGEIYSWPKVSKKIHEELVRRGYVEKEIA